MLRLAVNLMLHHQPLTEEPVFSILSPTLPCQHFQEKRRHIEGQEDKKF